MTKAELVAHIASETGLRRADAENALEAITGGIRGALAGGQKVSLVGFGTFNISHREARTGLNPRTKEPIQIAASNSVRFKAGKALKDAVN